MLGSKRRITFAAAVAAGSVALGAIVAPSCSQNPEVKAPRGSAEASTQEDESPPPSAALSAKKPGTNYADAMRRRQFKRAAELIDQATEEEQNTPEVRYARARAALETGDLETTIRITAELEKTSPLFRSEAETLRLNAAKNSNDVTLLVHLLGGSKDPSDQLLVAEAHERGSSIREARKIAENVLVALSKSKQSDAFALTARARMIKARTLLAEEKNAEAAREYHWLATEAAIMDAQEKFDEKAAQLDPKLTLNQKERMARLQAFADKGLVEQAEAEIEALKKLSLALASPNRTDQHLAWAVFVSRTDYTRAAELFAKAASHGGPDRAKHLYYEAKSLARSHRDQEAISKYELVATLGGTYGDHSAYQAARLRFVDGQWKAAVFAYEVYLKKYGRNAKHRASVEQDLPIARLAAEDFARAETELSALLKKEDNQRARARLMQLLGVAQLGAKKEAEADALFRRVIEYQPLSLPALLASARLRQMGKPLPPVIAPAPTNLPEYAPLKLSLPEKVWRLSRVGLDEESEAALKQHEARIRKEFGPRGGEALCLLYGQLESAQRRYQIAQTAATWSVLSQEPHHATAWQWDCIYPTPYQGIVREEAAQRRISPAFVYAIMRQESAFRPTVVSPAKAVGLMQIIPPTAERIAQSLKAPITPDSMRAPAVNITFGAYYLRYLLDIFGQRMELAAASYNAGPHAVTRWLRTGETLPLDIFVAMIPYEETRNYVYLVMGNYARYAYRDDRLELPEIDLNIPRGMRAPEDAY